MSGFTRHLGRVASFWVLAFCLLDGIARTQPKKSNCPRISNHDFSFEAKANARWSSRFKTTVSVCPDAPRYEIAHVLSFTFVAAYGLSRADAPCPSPSTMRQVTVPSEIGRASCRERVERSELKVEV